MPYAFCSYYCRFEDIAVQNGQFVVVGQPANMDSLTQLVNFANTVHAEMGFCTAMCVPEQYLQPEGIGHHHVYFNNNYPDLLSAQNALNAYMNMICRVVDHGLLAWMKLKLKMVH